MIQVHPRVPESDLGDCARGHYDLTIGQFDEDPPIRIGEKVGQRLLRGVAG
jgi:hypothetical protein